MEYKYFLSYREFKKQKDKNLFFDFDEIKAKKVIEQKSENNSVKIIRRPIYFANNVKGDSSYLSKNVVVKNISNLNKDSFKRALNYVVRHSDDFLCLDNNNEKLETQEVLKKWEKSFGKNANSKDVWHLVFSIKEQNNLRNKEKLLSATKETMDKNFFGYDYVLVPHSHQNNPHVHVLLNKRNTFTEKKIHFDSKEEIKYFFNTIRNDFARSLNARGFNYKNSMKLEQDLKKNLKELESISDSKVVLSEDLEQQQIALENKINNCNKKAKELKNILNDLYKQKHSTIIEALEAQRDGNRIYFKKFKEAKEINERIKSYRSIYKGIDIEAKNLYKNFIRLDNYRELRFNKSNDYITIESKKKYIDFIEKNYKKSELSKRQVFLLERFKKEIFIKENAVNLDMQNYIKTSLVANELFASRVNTFKLVEKQKELFKCLKLSMVDEIDINYFTLIQDNLSVVDSFLKKRYNYLEKNLSKKEKITEYSYKEFEALSKSLLLENDAQLRALALKIIGKSKAKEKALALNQSQNTQKQVLKSQNTQLQKSNNTESQKKIDNTPSFFGF